jgi:hypothetical protein
VGIVTYIRVGPTERTAPTVTGDWGGNAAGVSLVAALAAQGIVIDNTTNGRYAAAVLGTPGLIGYWRLGEASGTVATDSKGSNPGAYIGAPTLGVASIAGANGTAITLTGAQTVTIPHSASLNVGDVFSFECIVKRVTLGTIQALASKGNGAWCVRFDDGGGNSSGTANGLELLRSTVANIAHSATGKGLTDTASWHHVGVAKNAGTSWLICLDGIDVTAAAPTNSTLVDTTVPLVIGDDGTNNTKYPGSIGEVALYNTALTAVTFAAHWAQR